MSSKHILYGYQKNDLSTTFLIGEPKFPSNMLENANEMKSSFKCIVFNNRENCYEINTIVRHDESSTFWVVVGDTSSYIGFDSDGTTKIYSHTIEMEDALEYLSYKYLPPCVFPKDKYTLTQFLYRLQVIARLNDFDVSYPNFLSSDYLMKYFSFRNHTVASAIKEVSKSINSLPKISVSGGNINLSFINRYGDDNQPLGDIDTVFPSTFRRSNSIAGQYTTRVYSDLQNAKDSNIAVYPNGLGTKAFTPNTLSFDGNNCVIKVQGKIDNIVRIEVIMPCELGYWTLTDAINTFDVVWSGYLTMSFDSLRELILTYQDGTATAFTDDEIKELTLDTKDIQSIFTDFSDDRSAYKIYAVKHQKFYDELATSGSGSKEYCFYWKDNTSEIIVPTKMDFGGETFMPFSIDLISKDIFPVGKNSYTLRFSGDNTNIYFKVHYNPIADVMVSYDNDSEAQDERPYNQTGKLIDAYTTSKLISTYVDESASETLVRSEEYYSWASIPQCGQKVYKDNLTYVINQRSIDIVASSVYRCEFNLSIARTARDENISADGSIEKSAIPSDNLLKRVQIYKDYVELSVNNAQTYYETPYISGIGSTIFTLDDHTGIGYDIKMDSVARTSAVGGSVIDYVYVPTTKHNLVREVIYRADFDDNFIIGIKQGSGAVQTPIRYADANGEVGAIAISFVDEEIINSVLNATDFSNLPQLTQAKYETLIASSLISINENPYDKSSYEIPVFEYIYEIKGDINQYSQLLLNDSILERFPIRFSPDHYLFETPHYYYIISDIPITQENAQARWEALFVDASKSVDENNIVIPLKASARVYALKLYSTYKSGTETYNATALQGKHIGIYAVANEDSVATPKFIMAINYYRYVSSGGDKDYSIPIYLNNWKI